MIEDNQIYVVVDIEADGPVPGIYSLLSIGAVATTKDAEVDSFYHNVLPLEGASQLPRTMDWWATEPEAWQAATVNARPAEEVMIEFNAWIDGLGKKPVFVAHPVGLDYTFISWYLWKYVNKNPFTRGTGGSNTLDLASFIAGKFNFSLENSHRRNLPDSLKTGMPEHTHNALDDARGYAVILRNAIAATV